MKKEKFYSKIILLVLSLILIVPMLNSCFGIKLKYEINADGTTCTVTGALYDYKGDFEIPESIDGYTVTAIGEMAFYMDGFETVSIPATVTKIDNAAFSECYSLESVSFGENSKLEIISDFAFANCEELIDVILPEGLTKIGDLAFSGTNITNINIPSSVTECLGFSGCKNLIEITFAEDSQLTSLGSFKGCASLNKINIPDGVNELPEETFNSCVSLTEINLPKDLKMLPLGIFAYCSSLEKITIPKNVTTIGACAFQNCSSLVEIILPPQLTSIAEMCFDSNAALKKITIPAGVKNIDKIAFRSCSSLESVIFEENSNLTTIGAGAFAGCSSLKSITIPATVEFIENQAFTDSGLETAVFENPYNWHYLSTFSNFHEFAVIESIFGLSDSQHSAELLTGSYGKNYNWQTRK